MSISTEHLATTVNNFFINRTTYPLLSAAEVNNNLSSMFIDIDNSAILDLLLTEHQVSAEVARTQIQSWATNTPPNNQASFLTGDTLVISLTLSNNVKVNNNKAYLLIDNKRFEVDKSAFEDATDKTLLNFNYTVQANDSLTLSNFVIKNEAVFLTGISDLSDNSIDTASMPNQVLLGKQDLFEIAPSLTLENAPTSNDRPVQQFYVDLNADGYMDVVSTDLYNLLWKELDFYFFQGDDTNSLKFKQETDTPLNQWNASFDQRGGGSLHATAFADIDGDGDLDVLAAQVINHYDYNSTTHTWVFSHSTNALRYFENQNGNYTVQDAHSLAKINIAGVVAPTFADIDNDGDADLILGASDGTLHYFTNHQGIFTQSTSNPFTMDVGDNSAPAFADIDGDGDLDLLIGSNTGWHYYQNTNNTWIEQTPANNPFNGYEKGIPNFVDVDFDGKMDLTVTTREKTYYYHNTQHLIIDATAPASPIIKINDTSLAIGDSTLVEFHFKEQIVNFTIDDINAESAILSGLRKDASLGAFVWTATLTPASATDYNNTLTVGTNWHDVAGNSPSQITTSDNYQVINQITANISTTPTDWVFNTPPAGQNYFSIGDTMTLTLSISEAVQVTDNSAYITVANKRFNINKTAFDHNTDKTKLSFDYTITKGDHLISGDFIVNNTHLTGVNTIAGAAVNDLNTSLTLLKNSDSFVHKTGADDNPLNAIQGELTANITTINFVDLDQDGVQEMAYSAMLYEKGYYNGTFYYKSNTPTADENKVFTKTADNDNPFKNIGYHASMTFADMDKDGDLDLLTDNGYYKNDNGTFITLTANEKNPFKEVLDSNYNICTLVDLDNDGDVDLVTSKYDDGILSYYENNSGVYTLKTHHVLTGLNLGKAVRLNFKDLDGDGDLDLTSGSSYHEKSNDEAISYYENTGTINNPMFTRHQGDGNFFDHVDDIDIMYGSPAFSDVNGDGILDFVTPRVGHGKSDLLSYYEGTNIVKVKTTHYQDMDGITTLNASDKLTEHLHWNERTQDNGYNTLEDVTINNFDLFNDTLDISHTLKHLDDNAKLDAITLQKNGQHSTLSVGNFDITLTEVDVNINNLSHLIDTGTILI